ncbi:hypothetical protein RFI_07151 [Reticulomyxa filosa]|uniref:Uncharacterized protein n=1 Tax=Reticulomyxa filosa TaxID=46433 RepID=X6NVW8_RETFI|nr:hypothetical protein RFI_07151 [Reticulomyxa filosa]|eukprot:ETO29969.1 hypothetical protein RFI_07151 [Reticulomyxa filosa]
MLANGSGTESEGEDPPTKNNYRSIPDGLDKNKKTLSKRCEHKRKKESEKIFKNANQSTTSYTHSKTVSSETYFDGKNVIHQSKGVEQDSQGLHKMGIFRKYNNKTHTLLKEKTKANEDWAEKEETIGFILDDKNALEDFHNKFQKQFRHGIYFEFAFC